MKIGKKLYLSFGLIIAIMAMLFAINAAAVYREHKAKGEVLTALQAVRGMDSIRFQAMQNSLYLRNYLLSGDTREVDSLHEGLAKLDEILQKTSSLGLSDQQRGGLARVAQLERDWLESFANPLIDKRKQVDAGNLTVAELQIFYLQQSPGTWLRKVTDPLEEADRETALVLGESMKSDELAATTTTSVTWLCAFLTLVLGATIAYRTSKSITKPLDRLIAVAHDIGMKGDLEHTIEISRGDEIGDLARSFNSMVQYLREMAGVSEAIAGGDLTVHIQPRSGRDTLAHAFMRMTEGLRSLVRNVRDSAAQVAGGSSQVADASDESAKISAQASAAIDEVTSTMHEMSINVQNMVKNTQVQASSVSDTSASIDQMVTSIQRVADTAKALLEISHRSREEVKAGLATMERTTDGLNRINGSIHSSAEIIGSLDHRAEDIGKIIEVIDDLAEQTNLLALNAAIEAARAGEHGLGFAVVADEVRKLAEKSAQATKEIAELIQSIQREARKAVDNMDRSTTIVEEGLTQGVNLNAALTKISGVVSEVYRFAQEIGAATAEQSNGSAQIAKTTTRLNEITHEISSAVEEQAGGAQAVVKAMEKMRELMQQSTSGSTELAASSEQMSKMAGSLMQSMDRFVLETIAANAAARLPERNPPRAATAAAGRNGR